MTSIYHKKYSKLTQFASCDLPSAINQFARKKLSQKINQVWEEHREIDRKKSSKRAKNGWWLKEIN